MLTTNQRIKQHERAIGYLRMIRQCRYRTDSAKQYSALNYADGTINVHYKKTAVRYEELADFMKTRYDNILKQLQ